MRTKRIGGLVVLLIGVALIIISLVVKSRLTEARGDVSRIKNSPWGQNSVTDTVGNVMENKIGRYDEPVFWGFVGGVALVIIGGVMMVCCNKHTKKRRR